MPSAQWRSRCSLSKNLEGSITILGEMGSVKVGGVAVSNQTWDFVDKQDYDYEVKSANYETTSVYGFGHRCITVM